MTKSKFIIIFFKKNKYNIFKRMSIKGIGIIDNENFNMSNGHFIEIDKNKINIKNIDNDLFTKYEIINIENTTLLDNQCLNILEWLNNIQGKIILDFNKSNFVVKFLNILNIRNSFYINYNLNEYQLYKELKKRFIHI